MKFYHGTSKKNESKIIGSPNNVNVDLGGGELGKGFYTGENISLAISFAKGKFHDPAVIEFEIKNKEYAKLNFKQLNQKKVLAIWKQLRKLGQENLHEFGFDIVFGPLATNDYAAQYKFESKNSENLINNSKSDSII